MPNYYQVNIQMPA